MAKKQSKPVGPAESNVDDRLVYAKVIQGKFWEQKGYEFDTKFTPSDLEDPLSIHTTSDMVKFLEKNKDAEIEGTVLTINPKTGKLGKRMRIKSRESFLKNWNLGTKRFKENDWFLNDGLSGGGSSLVGQDYVPILGGPFNKQLYIQDYLKMNSACFFAYNHDPIARQAINIARDFTIGRGVRIDCEDEVALALIRAWQEVNKIDELLNYMAIELSAYGEIMIWELPDAQTKIQYQIMPGQEAPKGLIPRYRMVDPSCIWEIVTFPEDITRVLYYQWVAPTQYQIYSGTDAGQPVSSSKFIFQQIPAGEMMHYKINSVSNEKRGRSDLFPALSYMKRLRDAVQYEVIALQKAAAWAIDTTVEGAQQDIDNYVASQQALSTIAPAGSEFVHTKAVERKYLSNTSAGSTSPEAFQWCLSMIAAAVGIPVHYFGTHISSAGSRASAIVATEPVAKKFEQRQMVLKNILNDMIRRTLRRFGVKDSVKFDITFPEIVTADRSAKLKDLSLCEAAGWFNKERTANIAAQEMGQTKYDFQKEFADQVQPQAPIEPTQSPLTAKPSEPTKDAKGLASDERKDIADNGLNL